MKIKTRLFLMIGITVLFIIFTLTLEFVTSYQIEINLKSAASVSQMEGKLSLLKSITYDYMENFEERANGQWKKTYNELKQNIEQTSFQSQREIRISTNMISTLETMETTVMTLQNNHNELITVGAERKSFYENTEKRLKTELYFLMEEISGNILEISKINMVTLAKVTELRKTVVVLTLSILGLASIFLLYILGSHILKSIKTLNKGMLEIGFENLDHKIILEGNDELKNIAETFNNMTFRLKKSFEEITAVNSNLEGINIELEEANETLEDEINRHKQTMEELILAKERAESSNVAKSQFLANMSHELRTPMNGIIGMTDLTLMTEMTSEQKGYLDLVKKSSYSLLRIINDVLDISKIEAGKVHIESIPMKVSTVLQDVIALFDIAVKNKGLHLTAQIEDTIPSIMLGDPIRLRQVLSNLIGNAVKFTSKGGIDITVSKHSIDQKSIKLLFKVKDTGIGIPKDKQNLLFERFSQLDSTYSKKYQGTGLGLAITKKLVELMNGEIGLESIDGVGSTFFFTMTLQLDENNKFNN